MTLDQIKRHPDFPFERFREDDLQFLMLELFWATLFRDILPPNDAAQWTPEWPADRLDGNPILCVANRHRTPVRRLRVIQNENLRQLPALDLVTFAPVRFVDDAYVAFNPSVTFGGLDQDMTSPMEEVVLLCDVSPDAESLFRACVADWCVSYLSEAAMTKRIDRYWQRVNASLIKV